MIALGGGAVTSPRGPRGAARALLHRRDRGRRRRRRGSASRGIRQAARARRGRLPRALRAPPAALRRVSPTRRARDADGVVLAAGGVHVETGALERLGELVPGDGPVAVVSDAVVAGIHGADAQVALGAAARDDARAAAGRGGEGARGRRAALARAAARPRRHGRRARRRLRHRRGRLRRGHLAPRRRVGAGADDARRRRSTRRSAARRRSTSRGARTSSARSTGPRGRWSTRRCSRRCPSASAATGWPRS